MPSLLRPVISKVSQRYFSSNSLLRVIDEDGVRKITMVDTKTRNCLSLAMVDQLHKAIDNGSIDQQTRCIVIYGEGPVFSSGHNLKELMKKEGKNVFDTCNAMMKSMVLSPVPVIAAVDGLAAAAGCQMVAQTDIAICTSRSTFSTPGASFGIFCSTPGIPLVRSVNRKTAAHMLFTGLPINADRALQQGLVSAVVPEGQLDDAVKETVDAIKSKSRSVIQLGKMFFYKQLQMELFSAYSEGAETMKINLDMESGREGLKAFSEKRKPQWKD